MENFAATDTQNVTSLNRVISVSFGVASKSAVGPFGTIGLPNCSIGHVTVQNSITAVTDLGQALDPSGETAGRRFQRICAQEGIALDVIGDLDDTVAMGGESKETPVTLLTECVVADLGVMYESVETFGLGYRTRTSMYNQDPQLSLSYPASQLSGVPTPVDDLEFIKNSITATRTGSDSTGFTASLSTGDMSTEAPPAGIGTYNDPVALNVETDDDLANQAYWRLHVGTVDEARYPQITLDLSRSEITPDLYAAIIGLRAGDRIVITSPPAGQPPDTISQMLLGWSETIDNFQHIITLNCQPESPYHVGFTDNATYRIDTDGTILFSAATSSDTTLTVTPSDGQTGLWTTDSAETPWDIRVSGEVMTVTSCSSVGYDSFTRTTSSTWGTASSGQAWTEVGEAAADRSTNGASGILTLTANLTTTRRQTLVNSLTDCDVQVTVAPGQVSTGAALNAGILLRHQDTSAFYKVQLSFNTDSTVSLNLVNAFNNVGSVVTTGLTYIANDVFWLRARIDNQRVRARVWRDDGIVLPKDYWMLDVTVTSAPVAIGSVGVFGVGSVGITNVAPTLTFDSFDLLDPQTFTVTRSVNGVVKAQAAGADVRLANPAIIAL
jgi:hypothetical protein